MSVVVRANQAIKKGDLVKVIAGKEKGKSGKVISILSSANRVVVEHLNMIKRHQKPSASNRQGGIVEKEASIHLSNVSLLSSAAKTEKKTAEKKVKAKSKKKEE